MRCSVYFVCPSVLRCGNLKLHQTLEVKNIFKQEKIMPQLAFNPGLTLTGFRTTRPRNVAFNATVMDDKLKPLSAFTRRNTSVKLVRASFKRARCQSNLTSEYHFKIRQRLSIKGNGSSDFSKNPYTCFLPISSLSNTDERKCFSTS